jgi:nitrogen regulatory protein P-II 1
MLIKYIIITEVKIMKLIIAMIQPHKLPDVKQALFDADVHKMTVTNALGCGQQKGFTETYRGVIHEVNLLKKVKLEIAVNEDYVKPTIDAIIKGSRTGKIGDGKIFIIDLLDCIRIRTKEYGKEAIG